MEEVLKISKELWIQLACIRMGNDLTELTLDSESRAGFNVDYASINSS